MALVVRPAEPHELRAAADAMRVALLNPPADDAEWEKWRIGWDQGHLAITAWDGASCVGHAGSFSVDTLVPGGAWLPTAGVTRVGVVPTHTRRGALTAMMRRLLDDELAAGKVLASLRASEAVIYPRYGFGLAGEAVSVRVIPSRVRPVAGGAAGSFRLLRSVELLAVLPPLYERMQHRPGAITRNELMWRRGLTDALEGTKAHFVAVHSSPDGVDDGFVRYEVAWEHLEVGEMLGTCRLHDLFGTSPAVELALWDYLTSISLMRHIDASNRPVDEVVRHRLRDVRGYQVQDRWDEQWVRLLDVGAALAARTYRRGEAVVIAVDDPWYAHNCSTFEVSADGVTRVDTAAHLTASINDISAAYLGGVAWRDLVAVGRVGGSAEAAARADVLFAHHPTTWSGTFF